MRISDWSSDVCSSDLLEEALAGKKAGDRFEVEVAPEQGFGKRHDGLVQNLPHSMLDSGAEPQVGARLTAQTERGPLDVVVTAVDADTATVDGNHPRARRPSRARVEFIWANTRVGNTVSRQCEH